MVIIQNIMASAAKQSAVYQFLKDGKVNDIQEIITSYYDKMYNIRRKFDIEVWYCYRDFKTSAEKLVETIIHENKQSPKEDLSRLIHKTLTEKISWYDWAVDFYERRTPILVDKECAAYKKREQHMTVNSGGNNIILVWQDVNDVSYGCKDIISASTFVKYTPCSECSNNVITSADDIIISRDCFYHYETNFIQKCYGALSALRRDTYFIAAAFRNFQDLCLLPNACNNNGICKHIPYTTNYVCICYDYYEGENCETFNSKTANSNITNILTSLRQRYVEFSGVSTAIDVYYSVPDTSNAIQNLKIGMQTASQFKEILTFYANDFNIAKTYQMFDEFSQRLARKELHKTISGLLITYKKQVAFDLGFEKSCSEEYSTRVINIKDSLLAIEETLIETKLWNIARELQNLSEPNKAYNILQYSKYMVDIFILRQQVYSDSWIDDSCPKLNVSDLQQNFCDDYHSYDGLEIILKCKRQTSPSIRAIKCSRSEDGSLTWSAIPQCHQPGNWSSWSDCSLVYTNWTITTVSRGNELVTRYGFKTRQRSWQHKPDEMQHETCNIELPVQKGTDGIYYHIAIPPNDSTNWLQCSALAGFRLPLLKSKETLQYIGQVAAEQKRIVYVGLNRHSTPVPRPASYTGRDKDLHYTWDDGTPLDGNMLGLHADEPYEEDEQDAYVVWKNARLHDFPKYTSYSDIYCMCQADITSFGN